VKFGLGNFPADFVPSTNGIHDSKDNLSLADKWILSRLSDLIDSTNQNFTDYKFGDMVNGLYDFWRKELADVYLEAIKPVMKSENQANKNAALNTLYLCLDQALKLLHPTMPYLTEELYQRLPHPASLRSESICIAKFPFNLNLSFPGVKEDMDKTLLTVKAIRSQLAALNVASNAKPTIFLQAENPELRAVF
jgi:valyl-tRNA synthetase